MTAPETMIRLERFEKSYGKILAVKPLDLHVGMGETLVLLGPNGGGKSTIIRALVGLHAPTSGRVSVAGHDLVREPDRAREQLSYLPQRVTMPGLLTAREILTLFARLKGAAETRVDMVLAQFSLADDAHRYLREFSGGMLQRLGLAVTFLHETPLYVLDEPFLNLDPQGTEALHQLLQEKKAAGATIVFSSHILQAALRLADRVAILVEGELVEDEAAADFRAAVSRVTTVRVILEQADEVVLAAARDAGAHQARCEGKQLLFQAEPERRLAVIRAIEGAGGKVDAFHTENPDWEALTTGYLRGRGRRETPPHAQEERS